MKKNISNKILIVDDESEMRAALTEALIREGLEPKAAENGKEAIEQFKNHDFDLVISDVKMPQMTGHELLSQIKKLSPQTPVIMMTAFGTIDNAVELMKEGAFDYLLKPFSVDILISAVKRALKNKTTSSSKSTSSPKPVILEKKGEIITCNPRMLELLKFVENIAYSKSTVLIAGETGTGKEMFARYIHQCSPRSDQPFLAVNCAALPEGLLESELFGHEKGAFTGAINKKEGKFELANKGTILLDEVTEMSMALQAKLLRVLQEHEVDKVGGREPIPVDVRVIATTNRDPKKLTEENKFREDLYYRLNVIPINLPPLRERPEDIPALAEYFLKKHSLANRKQLTQLSAEAINTLKKYYWKGNVREMENIMERAVLICQENTLNPSHLFLEENTIPSNQKGKVIGNFQGTIQDMERVLIYKTLDEESGNKTRAAEKLGISIRTLRNKLNEYQTENHQT